jgi:site-specific DNA recombinase
MQGSLPMAERPKIRRCAIYTRKSSEEGLDQAYNSLDAQRDACAAYIVRQKHEGWVLVDKYYDDGGFSGGSLERPALKTLFADLTNGTVDIIVVYKIDRLTRSLADFAKLTELFDKHEISFVAVTQQFNTSTSMGRLTLNVLLSFAQFEREVTGERIRDKIAASKRRGMWMGGRTPIGYDVKDKKLIINGQEAETVTHIFKRYLELKSVKLLQADLERSGIRSKPHITKDGKSYGACVIYRGALSHIIANQIYRGVIAFKGELYKGEHERIVPEDLFQSVQDLLEAQGPGESANPEGPRS